MIDKFLLRYPEFSKVDPDSINIALEDAALMVCSKNWRKKYEAGLCALAAHYLWDGGSLDGSESNGAGAQVASSKTAGELSVSYESRASTTKGDGDGFSLSKYGRRYLQLRKSLARHFLVVPAGGGMVAGGTCKSLLS